MDETLVKNLMVPLEEYPQIDQDSSLFDAILALDRKRQQTPEGKQPHRAVLVRDSQGRIVGKIGELVFLTALEMKTDVLDELNSMAQDHIHADSMRSAIDNYQFLQEDFIDHFQRAFKLKVRDVMRPVANEALEETDTCHEALHKIVKYQTLSVLVTRRGTVVGVLRLSDLFEEVTEKVKALHDDSQK